jgi:hypothetical protein
MRPHLCIEDVSDQPGRGRIPVGSGNPRTDPGACARRRAARRAVVLVKGD